MPAGQAEHPVTLVFPPAVSLAAVVAAPEPNLPGGQLAGLQDTAPDSSWYDLKGQVAQPAAREFEPLALPFVPAGHGTHASLRFVRPL